MNDSIPKDQSDGADMVPRSRYDSCNRDWLAEKARADQIAEKAAALLREAAGVITDACMILDVVRPEWAEAWSEWDQSVRDRATTFLRKVQ
jgi:hypothetical protein